MALSNVVSINSLPWAVDGPIRQYAIPQPIANVVVPVRVEGDVIKVPLGDTSKGIGTARVYLNTGQGWGGYRDATLDTRWPGAIVLGILNADATPTTWDEVLRASAAFKGDIWTIWDRYKSTVTTARGITSRDFTGGSTTWGGGGAVYGLGAGSTGISVGLDLIAHKTSLIALLVTEAGSVHHISRHSTDGVTWTAPTTPITTGLLSDNPTANENIDAGLLATVRAEAVAVIWHESNGTITFYSSATVGDVWVDENVDIASGNGPQGVAVLTDSAGNEYLWVATREGLYEVDTSGATWTFRLRVPMVPHNDNGRRMVVHNGVLYLGVGCSNSTPAAMIRVSYGSGAGRPILVEKFGADGMPLGLNRPDGIPAELLGPFLKFVSTEEHLLASVGGGAASRNARIMEYDVAKNAWHTLYRDGTAQEKIRWFDVSSDDDGTLRLHFAERTTSDTGSTVDIDYLAQPFADPTGGVSVNRQSTGYIEFPEIRINPSQNGAILQALMDATGMSASAGAVNIAWLYGVNGTSPPASAGGTFYSDVLTLVLASGAGVASRTNGSKLTFAGSGSTTTPIMREMEVWMVKALMDLRGWECLIDIEESARLQGTPPETTLASMDTMVNSALQVEFTFADQTQTYVKVRPGAWDLQWSGDAPQRTGKVKVRLEELL